MSSGWRNGEKFIRTCVVSPCHNRWCVPLLRNARLQLTDELIGDLHDVSKSTEEDMQRIQELLASPQSEAVPQDVSRH